MRAGPAAAAASALLTSVAAVFLASVGGNGCADANVSIDAAAGGAATAPDAFGRYDAVGTSYSSNSSDAGCDNTQFDPHNCGSCGHDCEGGACVNGTCGALGAGVLASGQHSPGGIAVDAKYVYWANTDPPSGRGATEDLVSIVRCEKGGCNNSPTTIAKGAWGQVTNLVTDGTYVYWGASGTLFRCAVGGCFDLPTVLLSRGVGSGDVALGDASVYFEIPGSGSVGACSIDGCDGATALPIAQSAMLTAGEGGVVPPFPGFLPNSTVAAVATDGVDIYALETNVEGNFILACPPGNCSSKARIIGTQAAVGFAPLLAVDSVNLYFVNIGLPPGSASTLEAGLSATILGVTKDVGEDGGDTSLLPVSSPLVAELDSVSAMVSDGENVYFTEWGEPDNESGAFASGSGQIAKCAVTGCGERATPVQDYVNYPQGIAVDDTNVYWTDFGSGIDPSGSDDGRIMVRAK